MNPSKNLVLIPAMGCDKRMYGDLAEKLGAYCHVSVIVAQIDTLENCVASVLAEAPSRFVVLGTSFGGRVALEVALAAPDRIEGLVVIGAGAGAALDPAAGFKRANRLRTSEFEAVVTEMADMVSHLPGTNGPSTRDLFIAMARDLGGDIMARQSDALARRIDLGPRLHEIGCPALMLWGREDQFSPAESGLHMATAITSARYCEIADCGHFPSLEAPQETVEIVEHWMWDAGLISS